MLQFDSHIFSGNHKFDQVCKKVNIDHRLTAPATPKTNDMVERVNDTIKNKTIKVNTYQNLEEMKKDLNQFLVFYNSNRRHGGLVKKLKVRTPYNTIMHSKNGSN
ncbi:hypothetical protein MNBD_GAMMA03-1819 [hydrothermal vent metagenome]|uniref:Integrase catalytic domain-containing protein n=1 Tax=hydrothermal vent metagenome TaxID=652676 RepID=A0A3B0WCB4_9ZZZZ